MTKPANRILTLILLLQRQPNQKAADLSASLGVSVRTLHRYIAMLDEMGIPVYSERGPYGGFSLVRGFKMPPLVFSPEEATAVALGTSLVEEMWGHLYREAAHSALVKLENLLPEQQREEVKWARSALVNAGLVHSSLDRYATTVAALRRAMRECQQVKMRYLSATSGNSGNRIIDPYALVFRWGWWYVVGYCHNHGELRTFRIDRIQELSATDVAFQVPKDFNAREFMQSQARGQPQARARLRFAKEAVQLADLNRAAWDTFEQQEDGSAEVTVSAPDLNWVASTVLAYGPVVEVLDPPELRRLVRDWAQAILNQYKETGE